MTRSEIDSFYKAFDTAERADHDSDATRANYYADLALEAERDDVVIVLARVAFRFAIQEHYARERRRTAPWRRAARLTRTERLQGLADSGVDTWEEYRGER